MNSRGLPINSLIPNQISQQDTISQSDSGIEPSNSPSTILKRRTMMNIRSSNERLSNNSSVLHSNSANGLIDSHSNSTVIDRQSTYESLDNSLSSRQTKPVFEGIIDLQADNSDSISDDQQLHQYDRNSQIIDSSYADGQSSSSSPEKTRKQMISTKLFKPFQNMRFRKKNTTS